MRIAAIVLAIVLPVSAQAQCQSYGWRLLCCEGGDFSWFA